MPWNKVNLVKQRQDLIERMCLAGANISSICDQFNISRKTAYKWLSRYQETGLRGLNDRSKAPKSMPNQIDPRLEKLIIQAHDEYPYWGPRKLRALLLNQLSVSTLPSPTTFARVLKRHQRQVITNMKSSPATKRFERSSPNELWQMDFKGSFMTDANRCYPLTILDDCSRYSICLSACNDETGATVKSRLIQCFERFGMPDQINVDNGNPWGCADLESHTSIAIWLMKHSVRLTHSAPYHPQTNGKDERFHRTLKLEVLHNKCYRSCHDIQQTFDHWRHIYNCIRPHNALGGHPPTTRYQNSPRAFKDKPRAVDYDSSDIVRKVHTSGFVRFKGERYRIGKGLGGENVAIKETDQPDQKAIFFMDLFIKKITLKGTIAMGKK